MEPANTGHGFQGHGPTKEDLLSHFEILYKVAQSVTLDEHRAMQLVEDTYKRAFKGITAGAAPPDTRMWLMDLLLQVNSEQQDREVLLLPADAEDATVLGQGAASMQQHLAEQVARRLLFSAFLTLPEDLRTILVLRDVQGLSIEETARILGIGAESASVMLDVSRERLADAARRAATEMEKDLLESALPEDWIQLYLPKVMEADFPSAPQELRKRIEWSGRQTDAPLIVQKREEAPVVIAHPIPKPASPNAPAVRGVLVATIIIILAGFLGLFVVQMLEEEGNASLIALMAREADDAEPSLQTSNPELAEQYVLEQFGFSVTLPEIDQADLTGAGISELAEGVEIPIFLFEDASTGESFILYACNYAMLDRYRDRVTLQEDVLNQIADDEHFDLHDLGADKALIWRNRDDIFIAITRGDAQALRDRIFVPA
jgi:DNA-directed RNA polymerase specialized sigma24 family protein